MIRGGTQLTPEDRVSRQAALWWHEAEVAAGSGRLPRARRFLRWILALCPDDEDAWLWLAQLAPGPTERLTYLRQVYALHPESVRVQVALREARREQLVSAVGELKPRQALVRCLPNERRNARKEPNSKTKAGQPHLQSRQTEIEPRPRLLRTRVAIPKSDPLAWLVFLLPLLVYLLTACSTVYNLDSAEFSAAVHVLGIVRATGYPLYLLLGKAFALILPVGDIGFRLNVMSAVCAAGTVVLLYHLLQRLTQQRAAALASSLLFAFSYYLWTQAVVAEAYTLHTLLLAALLLLLLRWEASRADGLLAAIGLLYGLSFGNHMSTLLLAPGLVLFILAVGGRVVLHPKRLLMLLIPFVLGLGIYLYIPLRYLAQPPFNYAGHYDAQGHFIPLDMTYPANLWWLISGQGFQALMFGYTPAELLGELGRAAHRLWGSFLGIGLVPGLLGAWIQGRSRPRHMALFGLVFMTNMIFFSSYRVVDKAVMFLPAYLIWAVWIGEGFAWLIRWVQGHQGIGERHSPAWSWGLAALAVVALIVNWPLVDVHADTRACDLAEAALAQARPNAIIFGWWTSAPPLHYQQLVEGQRPDVLVINRFLIGADEMYTLIDHSLGNRPVYVMELDEGLIGAYTPVPVGPMFELTRSKVAEAGP